MKNQQGAPEALRPIARYKIGYATDGWGMRSSTPSGIPHHAGAWVRYEDHVAALVEAQQPAPLAASALSGDLRDRLVAISEAIADQDDRAAQAMLREILAAPQPSPTPQADSAQDEPLQAFDSPRAQALMRAWEEGWAACRDAEYVGEEAQNDAFNSSHTLTLCIAEDQQLPAPQADSQPAPIDMVLHCPACGLQHIDEPDWQNDPQLGAIRYANAQQRIDTSGDREAQQSHHEPVQVLLRYGGMASGGHAEQPVQEVQLPATAIHEANKSMHVVSSGNGRFTVLQGQQNGQPSSEVQGLPQERNRRLEEDQSGRGESGGTSPKQSAARDEAIRLDARGVSGAPESSRADLQHLREGRASEAQEGPSIAGSLPCNGQDSGRAVLSLQHDAGLRERRLNVASQRDQVSCEAPLRAPIHRSHLCRPEDGGCGHIWRPADVPTNGVAAVKTTGKADSPIAPHAPADSVLDAARLWDAFIEAWRNEIGVGKIVNIMGGADKLKAVFLDAARKQGGKP